MDWQNIFATRMGRMKASEIRELLKLLDQPDIISFAGGIPDPDLFPKAEFAAAFADIFASGQGTDALQYSVSEGYLPLRQWIAAQMADLGIPCGCDNILITSGSQQALDYLGKLLLSKDDTALVNWPTYLGALGAFNAYEPHFDQISANSNRPASQYQATAKQNGGAPKFAYMSVDFANPTGETMDRRARLTALDLAAEMDIAIIEDAAYQSLRYDGEAIPPILALEIERTGSIENCRTIYCGSFSKTLAPGLRVGWVCAAKSVIQPLVLMKQAADLHSSTINQIAIHKVASTGFAAQTTKIRAAYCRPSRSHACSPKNAHARRRHLDQTRRRHVHLGHTTSPFRWRRPVGKIPRNTKSRFRPRPRLFRGWLERQHPAPQLFLRRRGDDQHRDQPPRKSFKISGLGQGLNPRRPRHARDQRADKTQHKVGHKYPRFHQRPDRNRRRDTAD